LPHDLPKMMFRCKTSGIAVDSVLADLMCSSPDETLTGGIALSLPDEGTQIHESTSYIGKFQEIS